MADDAPEPDDAAADPDDLFAAAAGEITVPEPDPELDSEDTEAEPEPEPAPEPDPDPVDDLEPDTIPEITSLQQAQGYQAPRPGSFGYHAPPPSGPGGEGGYRAGSYPAGPPAPVQPQFGRRAPRQGPRPDADGYYPGDYYLGVDWTRVVLKGLAGVTLLVAAVAGGLWVYDRFEFTDDEDEIAEVTPTPIELVPVFECAGDDTPVTEIPAPDILLIAGRTADSRYLAFRNPSAPPRQLWVESSWVPGFDSTTVGIVPCASSPQEFPTPIAAPGQPTPPSDGQPDGPTPTPVATPTP